MQKYVFTNKNLMVELKGIGKIKKVFTDLLNFKLCIGVFDLIKLIVTITQ